MPAPLAHGSRAKPQLLLLALRAVMLLPGPECCSIPFLCEAAPPRPAEAWRLPRHQGIEWRSVEELQWPTRSGRPADAAELLPLHWRSLPCAAAPLGQIQSGP